MKKTITILSLLTLTFAKAQIITADFESFTLTPKSFYKDTNSVNFQTTNAIFQYAWNKSFGGYWSAGFAYTNMNDSVNGTFTNLYGCIPDTGYFNSKIYVTGQDGGIIKLKAPNNFVNGFYITNTTYAWKVIKKGGGPARKFGDTTGTKSGLPQGSYPDWFKVTVKGFSGGVMKPDSSEFYLADYRFANNSLDYAVKNWQWMDCSNLGNVDSIQFHMYSSDAGAFGINTPTFFSIDNFTTSQGVGIHELSFIENLILYPNPVSSVLKVQNSSLSSEKIFLRIFNSIGTEVKSFILNAGNSEFDLSDLNSGMYFAELNNKDQKKTFKLVKE